MVSIVHEAPHPAHPQPARPGPATETAARDIALLPWRGKAMRTPPLVSPESGAQAITRALERGGGRRRVHPVTLLVPLELPVAGRAIAAITARRIDPRG